MTLSEPFTSGLVKLYHMDCLEYMRGLPDKAFELAVCDPPYGINFAKKHTGNGWVVRESKSWDSAAPDSSYFDQLFRVSKNQIIWGANYMTPHLPPSQHWIFWDKGQRNFSLADGELAYSSFDRALRVFEMSRGAMQAEQGMEQKFHPTQKPVKLYEWLLTNYAKKGDRILDTHLGSGSSAIASHNLGFDFTGCELDQDYYEASVKRFNAHAAQQSLFSAGNETDFVTKQEALL
jgi:site-specific DNA-methyltransferase (adenine-specific)